MPDTKTYISEDQILRNMIGVMNELKDLPPTVSLKICHQYTSIIYYQGLGPLGPLLSLMFDLCRGPYHSSWSIKMRRYVLESLFLVAWNYKPINWLCIVL